jgi:long-subunit acyl-CoA synthetase (AMP-forming)
MLPLEHAEAAPLRRCAAVLYGGSALSASAAAAYRALGVSAPARTARTPYAVRGGNLPRLQAANSRVQAATSRVQVTLLAQYGQTELAGMVLLSSPQAPPGAMQPVPGLRWRLQATETAARGLLGRGSGGGRRGAEGGGGGAEGELQGELGAEAEGYLGDLDLEGDLAGELVLVDAACHTPGYWHLAAPAAAAPAGGGAPVAAVAGDEWHTGDVFNQLSGGWLVHRCRRDELLLHSSGEMTNPVALEEPYLPPNPSPLHAHNPSPLPPASHL